MVHALQEIRKLLKPKGALIDIRPNGELVQFIRPLEEGERFIGYMHETILTKNHIKSQIKSFR